MNSRATIIDLSAINEDEVEISINDKRLVCFIAYCPYDIQIGEIYDVEISLYFINDQKLEISLSNSSSGFERISNTFSYYINGHLQGNKIFSDGLEFEDDILYNYSLYDNKSILLKVDRVDIAFL